MPFVRIDAIRVEPERLELLGDAVQQGLVESIGIPQDDRFQVLTSHDGQSSILRFGSYLDIPRDDAVVFIDISMRAGRTDEQKRALFSRVCELAHERVGIPPHDVLIVIRENTSSDWSFGYGQAQYLPG